MEFTNEHAGLCSTRLFQNRAHPHPPRKNPKRKIGKSPTGKVTIEFQGDQRGFHRPLVLSQTVGHRPAESFEDAVESLPSETS